ncbi:stress response protein NST1 [Tanacetum coccineum]
MGFSSVYKVLQDVFPQVDSRLLRAYAIEHAKDVDVAVEAVLAEIIPTLPAEPAKVSSPKNSESTLKISEVAVDGGKTGQAQTYMDFVGGSSYPAFDQSTKADRLAVDERARDFPEFSYEINRLKLREPEVSVPLVTYPSLDADNESDDELIVLKKRVVNCSNNPDSATSVLVSEINPNDNHDQGFVKFGGENVVSFGEPLVSLAEVSGSSQIEDTVQLDEAAPAAKDDSYIHLDVDTLSGPEYTQSAFTQESNINSSKPASEKDAFAESFEQEDGSTISSVLTESNQDCSTELLEQIIEEAKNNKQTLVLAMNSVVDLMNEVEVKERAAEEVKEKAAEGCSDILSKVDELKQALIRAKEANDMHAGEVCAEKAILATELKELQLRLFTMSDERNRSLAILDEMRQALEIRLASAMNIINQAEEEKLEKEKSAREALLFQENQMEKVVEESKKLKLEAEENSKFQEFLMDRGRAIDILQGEISVKCQDVLLLKEKFDKRIPLSRSLSSSQTSSILASSGSFRSTTIAPLEHESETYESPKKSAELNDSYGFLDRSSRSEAAESPKSPIEAVYPSYSYAYGGENLVDGRKARIVDDGWELFENDDYLGK